MSQRDIVSLPCRIAKFTLAICAVAAITITARASTVTFTGHADTDFGSSAAVIHDGIDSGLGGWDIEDVYFDYDGATDTLYVGLHVADTVTFFGDADLDGFDVTNTGSGGEDNAKLGGSEFFYMDFDVNQEDIVPGADPDTIVDGSVEVGDGKDLDSFHLFDLDPYNDLGGNDITYYPSPSSSAPDFEFTIASFSSLGTTLGVTDNDPLTFGVRVFAGSDEDNSGEESIVLTVITVPEPSTLLVSLACILLAIGGRKRRALSL